MAGRQISPTGLLILLCLVALPTALAGAMLGLFCLGVTVLAAIVLRLKVSEVSVSLAPMLPRPGHTVAT